MKTAQSAFLKSRAALKIAQDDMSISSQDKEQMAEQVIALADELVSVAVEAVEGGDMLGNEMISPQEGVGAPGDIVSPTDIPLGGNGEEDNPDKKLNTAMGERGFTGDNGKLTTAQEDDDTKKEMKEMRKELDAMKSEKIHIKLAQKYSDIFPVALRSAQREAFLSHKEPTAVLEARLDEASTLLAKPQAMKIAQEEDSVFNFEELDGTNGNSLDMGGKI